MAKPRLADPLRRRAFRRLATTYAVNELGDWMAIVALSVLVFDETGSAMATAALFIGTRFLPALLAPLLVARVEQPPPRFSLPAVYCCEAAVFAILALFVESFSLPAVVVLATLDGALALTGRALTRAVVASLLEPAGELRAGNAILNVAFTGGAAVGPAIAGVIVAGLGVETALLLDAVSFYAMAVILLTAGPLPHAEPDEGRVRDRVRAGVGYIRRQTTLRRLMVAQGIAFVFFAAVIPVEVVYAKETLDAGDSGYGLLLASWGGGMVLGSLVFAVVRRAPLGYLLFFSTLAVGAGYLWMAGAPVLALACAAAILGGSGNGIQWVSTISAVQELTIDTMQARVMSVLESVGAAMPGVGFLIGGVVSSAGSPRLTFAIAGAGVILTTFAAAALLRSALAVPAAGSRGFDPGSEIVVELRP